MQHQTRQVDRVVLIGDKGSAVIDRIASDQGRRGIGIARKESGELLKEEIVEVVTKFVNENPALLHEGRYWIVERAVSEAFPCTTKKGGQMSDFKLQFLGRFYWRWDASGKTFAGPFCPKCFEGSGTVSEMEMQESRGSGHFAQFRSLSCPVCNHSDVLQSAKRLRHDAGYLWRESFLTAANARRALGLLLQ